MGKKKKIAIWFRYGPADHSELFHAMPAIVEELSKNAEVHYYGLKTKTDVPKQLSDNAVLHWLPFSVVRSNNRDKLLKTLLWICCLPFVALDTRFKSIQAVYIDENIPLAAPIARLFFGKNVAVSVADFFTDIYCTGRLTGLGNALKALDFRIWRQFPLIFTRAKTTQDFLEKHGINRENVVPVYDPCDMELYHPVADKKPLRKRFGFSDNTVVLVHHGILHPNKGNDRIIRALAEMGHPNLHYLLLGDGPEMGHLKKLVADLNVEEHCTLTGWLPKLQDVNDALNAGDIGLVMRIGERSDDFHMTGALVHNMACGLPLLAARLGGVSEVVDEGRNGLLFDPNDMEEFKTQLTKFIRSPTLREHCGKEAAADALDHFDMKAVTKRTVDPLLELLEN